MHPPTQKKQNNNPTTLLLCLHLLSKQDSVAHSHHVLCLITWFPCRNVSRIARGNHCHCGCRMLRLLCDVKNKVIAEFRRGEDD